MNDVQRTTIFGAVAAVLLVLTLITGGTRGSESEMASAQGGAFYPEFTDPLSAASLEVVEWDVALSEVKRFRVEQQPDGLWVIPSHSNYPADAQDRLAHTAGRILGLERDVLRSTDKKELETFGVVDPEELNVIEKDARGKRVILRDRAGNTLADYIFGKKVDVGGNEMVYVRVPGKDETYAVKSNAEITAKFEDWIETDLLKLTAADIRKIVIDNYSIDEVAGVIKDRHAYFVSRDESAGPWKMGELKDDEEINSDTVFDMTSTLDDLKIVGVRRKQENLRRSLAAGSFQIDPFTEALLRQKGYYILRERDPQTGQVFGQLVSNEGEINTFCSDGVVYTLRFGEILVGTGDEISAGSEEEKKKQDPAKKDAPKKGGAEHRYLFVTARFDEELLGNPPSPPKTPEKKEEKKDGEETKKDPEQEKYEKEKAEYDRKKKEHDEKVEKGKKRAQELSGRFAEWYYVINAESFKKLRKERKDLVKKKEKTEEEKKKEEEEKQKEEAKPEEKKPADDPKGAAAEKPKSSAADEKKGEAKPEDQKSDAKKPEESKESPKKTPPEKKPE